MLVFGLSWQSYSNLFSTYCVASQYPSNVWVQKLYGVAFKSLFSLTIFQFAYVSSILDRHILWQTTLLKKTGFKFDFKKLQPHLYDWVRARTPRHAIQLDQPPWFMARRWRKCIRNREQKHTRFIFFTMKYLVYIVNKTTAELAIKIKELVFRTFHSLF